jgi:GH25 family lysozyme M1 (1,4-beta-N-acetylmuramidase)
MKWLRRVTILRAATASGVVLALALSLTTAAGASAAVTEAGAAPVRGLDISAYQHARSPIDWGLLAEHGIRFVAIKVSEGTYYVNPYYPSDERAAAATGIAVLPYVFANPRRVGGTPTASFAVSAMGSERGRLPLVVDLENDPYNKTAICYGLGIQAMLAWITRFTAQAAALTGKWPVIYTTADWWQECTGQTGRFRRDPLWLAAFDGAALTVPSPWHDWTFWQYNNDGSLPGIGEADLDYYEPTGDLPVLNAPTRRASKKKPKPDRHLRRRPAQRKRAYRKSLAPGQ